MAIDGKRLIEEKALRAYERTEVLSLTGSRVAVIAEEFGFVAGLVEALNNYFIEIDAPVRDHTMVRIRRDELRAALESLEKKEG